MDNALSNPVVIMVINMTIVFAVLGVLDLFIRFIRVIDPTKKKKIVPMKEAEPRRKKQSAPAAAPAIAAGVSSETVAVIAAALAAYGVGFSQIRAIRPAERPNWLGAARISALQNKM